MPHDYEDMQYHLLRILLTRFYVHWLEKLVADCTISLKIRGNSVLAALRIRTEWYGPSRVQVYKDGKCHGWQIHLPVRLPTV